MEQENLFFMSIYKRIEIEEVKTTLFFDKELKKNYEKKVSFWTFESDFVMLYMALIENLFAGVDSNEKDKFKYFYDKYEHQQICAMQMNGKGERYQKQTYY